jgi:hypothetical protein
MGIMAHNKSRHFQTTDLLHSVVPLLLPHDTQIRLMTPEESESLSALVRKHNVFARHRSSFYLERINELGNRTIIETQRPGEPDDVIGVSQYASEWAERVVFVSAALAIRRSLLHRALGTDVLRETERAITIGPQCYSLRAKSRRPRLIRGVEIDARFLSRFKRYGFAELYSVCLTSGELAERLRVVVAWLHESRQEPHEPAALVKTSIALESLLVFNESESLSRSLSERSAFLLTPDPQLRKRISSIVKRFYEARSGIVHGSHKKAKNLTPTLLDGVDRLLVLLCLVVGANVGTWKSKDGLREWCEEERWGKPSSIHVPFTGAPLKKAVSLCEE